MIKNFQDLETYQHSQKLYPETVKFSKDFSREAWHLKDQLCRSANSIHSNIAEGFGRSVAEFKMYLTRSLGSCNETLSHINDAINTENGNKKTALYLLKEYEIVGKQIYRLREHWK